jgi:hypothetical protein
VGYMEDVLEAVRDPEWQRFRQQLKGMDTASKLNNLKDYYDQNVHITGTDCPGQHDGSRCAVCIRLDNYLKALARGGRLYAGVSLEQALTCDWNLRIRK